MRQLLWIFGLSAFVASLAILSRLAPTSAVNDADRIEQSNDRSGGKEAAQAVPLERESPLPTRSPTLRGGMPQAGLAVSSRSASCGMSAECRMEDAPDGATPGAFAGSRSAHGQSLLAKRVRLQI